MSDYHLRDKAGTLKAAVTQHVANSIFANIDGHWETRSNKRVYIIDRDSVYEPMGHQIRVFLWEGDVVIAHS